MLTPVADRAAFGARMQKHNRLRTRSLDFATHRDLVFPGYFCSLDEPVAAVAGTALRRPDSET